MKSGSSIPIKFLILLALVNICVSQDFDFFYFVQQWPGSFCDTKEKVAASLERENQLPISAFMGFGLISAMDHFHPIAMLLKTLSIKLRYINKPFFFMHQITGVIPRAQSKNKTNNNTSSDNTVFWKHEWDKHGTCSESVLDQHAYFELSLNLKDRVNLLQILQNSGIKPDGNHYKLGSITEAIKQAVGFVPGIRCNTDPSGNSQLNEIFLCVDKSASNNFIACPILPKANCPDSLEFPIF